MFNVVDTEAITLTDAAVAKVREVVDAQGEPNAGLRVYIAGGGCSGFKYGMALESNPASDDEVFSFGGLRVFVDQMSLPYLKGARVDYVDDELLGQGFKVDNPNAVSSCGCGQSFKAADGEAAPAGAGGGCGSGGCGSH